MKPLAALLLAFASFAAHAQHIEVGVGYSHAASRKDGTWYQKAFPHELNLHSPVLMAGLTDDWSKHWRWHLDAVYLGHASVDSWDTPNDDNYNPKHPSGCNGPCLPLVNYRGTGYVAGIAATAEVHTAGEWQFGVEGGPFVYYATWNMAVPQWYPSQKVAPQVFAAGPVTPLSFTDSHVALGWVMGASVRRGPWALSYRAYIDDRGFAGHPHDSWQPIWSWHNVVMVTYRF